MHERILWWGTQTFTLTHANTRYTYSQRRGHLWRCWLLTCHLGELWATSSVPREPNTRVRLSPLFLKLSSTEMWTRSRWALFVITKKWFWPFWQTPQCWPSHKKQCDAFDHFKTKYFTIKRRDVQFASHNSKLHRWVWAYSVNMPLVAIFPSLAIYRENNESVNRDKLLQISQYCCGLKHRPCLHTNGLADWMLLSRSTLERPSLVCHTSHTVAEEKKHSYNLRLQPPICV